MPHFLELAHSMVGRHVTMQAECILKQGVLRGVCADYVTIESNGIPFFIRTEKIIFITVT